MELKTFAQFTLKFVYMIAGHDVIAGIAHNAMPSSPARTSVEPLRSNLRWIWWSVQKMFDMTTKRTCT